MIQRILALIGIFALAAASLVAVFAAASAMPNTPQPAIIRTPDSLAIDPSIHAMILPSNQDPEYVERNTLPEIPLYIYPDEHNIRLPNGGFGVVTMEATAGDVLVAMCLIVVMALLALNTFVAWGRDGR